MVWRTIKWIDSTTLRGFLFHIMRSIDSELPPQNLPRLHQQFLSVLFLRTTVLHSRVMLTH
jgi:hypothetical protein